MRRIVILGGTGFFGRLIGEQLSAAGQKPLLASRSSGELRIDANIPEDLKANLKTRDLVIDAAGPFQRRSPALIEAARTIGFDLIDLSDSPEYTAMIYKHEAPIRAAGIRVLTACSALSTVSAVVLNSSGVEQPRKLLAYLKPASRHTANPATIASMLASFDGGQRTFEFPRPLGVRNGLTVKSVDMVTLPRVFASLRFAELAVDAGVLGNAVLASKTIRKMIGQFQKQVVRIAHSIGRTKGILAYEITHAGGHSYQIFTGDKSYMLAVIPAVQAALAIINGKFPHRGLIAPTDHVNVGEFLDAVRKEGVIMTSG